ncbi:MAG: polyprenyl synthetase family protein [Spirochaetaceae bacterium]|nr:MAG: polyprenyl synthetase family protein [Spirochaetaceae bacterium]
MCKQGVEAFPHTLPEMDRVREIIFRELEYPGGHIGAGLLDFAGRESRLLRPALALLSARIAGGDGEIKEAVPHIAAALELLHMATLIHDDILDDAEIRRGKAAVHTLYGVRRTVLMGDFLFARCYALLASWGSPATIALFSSVVGRIVAAEIDAINRGEYPSLRRYKRRIVGKTALLFVLACHAGASEAAGPGETSGARTIQETLRRTGYNLGVSFQIRDDILDIVADAAVTGKPRGQDPRAGLVTLPLMLAGTGDPGLNPETIFRGGPAYSREIPEICDRIVEAGGTHRALLVADAYAERAMREVSRLPSGSARDCLESIVRSSKGMERERT